MKDIVISVGEHRLSAQLNESPTARQIWNALPLEGAAKTWGDEIYFEIPVEAGQEPDARSEVEVGELGYWPLGQAFCIFFGPTPASTSEQPRAYSPVNIVGRLGEDATVLRSVRSGQKVHLEPA